MKYRTDFVTNSSSTSFASAALTSLLALIASCKCAEPQEVEIEEEEQSKTYFRKSVMPEGTTKLVQGGDSIYLYAQLVRDEKEGTIVLASAIPSITFEVKTGSGWLQLGKPEVIEDWAAVEVTGIANETGGEAPAKISVKAKCKIRKVTYSATFNLDYEAEPTLYLKSRKCDFLSGLGESMEIQLEVKNPGNQPWGITADGSSWANQLCTYEILESEDDKEGKAILLVTELDTLSPTGTRSNHYSRGEITIRASNGEKELEDKVSVYIWREGLFYESLLDGDRTSGEILVDADRAADGTMKTSSFDLRYLRWNTETKALVCDTAVFTSDQFNLSDPEAQDQGAETILEKCGFRIKYEGERPSNMPSGKFSAKFDQLFPGFPEQRFRFTVTANVFTDDEAFSVEIPFAILPAVMGEGHSEWKTEVENCRKIINTFFPEEKRAEKLAQFENAKHVYDAAALKKYRTEIWEICQNMILKQSQSYLDEAAWYDNAVYYGEWIQWFNDRVFNVVLGTLTGPIGAIIVGQGKDLMQDCIEKFFTVKETDSWLDIGMELVGKRVQGTLGGSIDAAYFSEPEVSKSWILSFFVYKWIWHWAFDMENGERKGCVEAVKSAFWDLTGAGFEEKIKAYIGDKATKEGYSQNMSVDEYVTKMYAKLKPYIDRFMEDESGTPKD